MNLDIGRAFKMTVADKRWFETLLIGVLIWVVASVVARIPYVGGVANVFVLAFTGGYCLKVMREETYATAANLPLRLPKWENWDELFRDGILLTVLNTIYTLFVAAFGLLVTVMIGATGFLSQALENGNFAQVPGEVAFVWMVFMVLFGIAYAIYMPVMAAHFAHEGRFTAGFEAATIFKRAFAHPGNLFLVMITMIGCAVILFLSAITIVLLPFAAFATQVILANVWAQVYRLGA